MIADPRSSPLRRVAAIALVVDVAGSLAAVAYGVYGLLTGDHLAVALGFLVGGGVGLLVGLLLYCQFLLVHKFVSYTYRAYHTLLEMSDLLRRQEVHTRSIAENSGLSEWAKRIVYREKDYEFLRDSIHGAIIRQDWESAAHLIDDVERQFGYHDEAAHLREQLEQARQATTEERVVAALARFEHLCNVQKWEQAEAESARLAQLFPGDPKIARLPHELELQRGAVKQRLMRAYEAAVANEDIDQAHRLLYDLDHYLAPREVEALKASARTVFRARLEQLKTQFGIAVSYKQFHNAISVGEQLCREFPNSGYAQEISKLMPVLRERARAPHAAGDATLGSAARG